MLIGLATREWQSMARIAAKLLTHFLETGIRQTGDLVLLSRLADLAEAGALERRGDLADIHRCELRLPS
jgi:hypothetical protein